MLKNDINTLLSPLWNISKNIERIKEKAFSLTNKMPCGYSSARHWHRIPASFCSLDLSLNTHSSCCRLVDIVGCIAASFTVNILPNVEEDGSAGSSRVVCEINSFASVLFQRIGIMSGFW